MHLLTRWGNTVFNSSSNVCFVLFFNDKRKICWSSHSLGLKCYYKWPLLNAFLSCVQISPRPPGYTLVSVCYEHCLIHILRKGERVLFSSPWLTGFPPSHQNEKRCPLSLQRQPMNIWDIDRRCCLLDRLVRCMLWWVLKLKLRLISIYSYSFFISWNVHWIWFQS